MESPADVPDITDPAWNDYVLTHFVSEELIDGHPNVSGLRRVARKLLGKIISSNVQQVFPVNGDGPGRATVVYEIRFIDSDGAIISYSDVADVWDGNTDALFMSYAVATAATRAEGRALRKALHLRVCAAEELTKKNAAQAVVEESVIRITQDQILHIDKKCSKFDIDAFAFINSGEKQYRSINDVTRETASKMIKKINEDGQKLSESFKGYKAGWNK